MPNYGTIIEITGNEAVIKNTFRFGIQVFGYSRESVQLSGSLQCTLLFKSNGNVFLRWQNMVFIFKVQTWNFVCGIRRSFAFTMKNILSVWYTATPGRTSKFGKVWKTRCQNAATRANIWRCFLVSWDGKYLWVMVSNNQHELYFCSKLLCFSSIHWFFWPNTVSKYQTWTNSYLIPSNA